MIKLSSFLCGCVLTMIVGLSASHAYAAGGVTSITVAGEAVGNSLQYATATIAITCTTGTGSVYVYAVNNNQVLSAPAEGGSPGFSLAYTGVPCGGSLTVRLHGQYEVRAANDYQFGACVNEFQGCTGAATASVRIVPATYSVTARKKQGVTTDTMVRTPVVGNNSTIWYNLGNSQCTTGNIGLPPGGSTLQWTTTVANAAIYNCGPASFGTYSGIDFPPHFPINQAWTPQLRLRGAIDTQSFGSQVVLPGPVTAHVPLGSRVKFLVTDEYGQALSTSFALSLAAVESGVLPRSLFPNHVVFAYTARGANDISYQAVHRGQVTVTLTAAGVAPASFAVTVENPSSLGSGSASSPHMQFNPLAYPIAHQFGIPPQYLKAHVHKESTSAFNGTAYRYEPMGPQGDMERMSGPPNFRKTQAPYKDYRFATLADSIDGPLSEGQFVNSADRTVAVGELWTACDQYGRGGHLITTGDAFVSAADLVHCNGITLPPSQPDYRKYQFWWEQAGANAARRYNWIIANPFTAQLSLAASYGYLQILYSTALQYGWTGTAAGINPSSLFDTPANISAGGGSLTIGAVKVSKDYVAENTAAVATNPDGEFATPADFLMSFRNAWSRYNVSPSYPAAVAGLVNSYPIVPARSLF